MNRCLWALSAFCLNQLYSQEVEACKYPIVLEKVVTKFFIQEHFIYPLYNVKPLAYGLYSNNEDWRNVLSLGEWNNINNFEFISLKNYLEENLSSNFLLLEEPNPYFRDATNVYFVNKTEFLRCCHENFDSFKKILGSKFNPSVLLQDLEDGKCTLLKSLHYNEQLFGILLGFGAQNSYEFSLFKDGNIHTIPFSITDFVELQILGEKHNPLVKLYPIHFVGVAGTDESLNLQKKYAEKHSELCNQFSDSKVKDRIIRRLTFYENSD